MSKLLLAVVAMLSIGVGIANAKQLPSQQQTGDRYNFLEGGGG